jgi:uncharacterized protein YbjT (DUF2867 family)
MSTSILVTGASGNIGAQLLSALREKGLEATAMTSRPDHTIPGYRTIYGDLGNQESLREAFRGFETIFLLQPLMPQMVEYGLNAVAAAKAAGVGNIVRSSGAGADSNSPFSIAKAHGLVDDAVRSSGMKWTLLRPTSFMQNYIQYNADQIRNGTLYAPHGTGATSLIDVRDIAECAAVILANPAAHQGKSYDLTGGEALTDVEQMAILSAGIGRAVHYVDIPAESAADAMAAMGMPAVVIDWLMSLNAIIRVGYAAGISEDVLRLTGHAPRTFAAFVKDYAQIWSAACPSREP